MILRRSSVVPMLMLAAMFMYAALAPPGKTGKANSPAPAIAQIAAPDATIVGAPTMAAATATNTIKLAPAVAYYGSNDSLSEKARSAPERVGTAEIAAVTANRETDTGLLPPIRADS